MARSNRGGSSRRTPRGSAAGRRLPQRVTDPNSPDFTPF